MAREVAPSRALEGVADVLRYIFVRHMMLGLLWKQLVVRAQSIDVDSVMPAGEDSWALGLGGAGHGSQHPGL